MNRAATAARHRADPLKQPRMPSASINDSLLVEGVDEVRVRMQRTAPPRYWPARATWLSVLWLGLAGLVVALFNVVTVPLVMLSVCWNSGHNTLLRMIHRNTPWRRSPGGLRVAVIGAGWGGLQAAARLTEHGVQPVIFESRDDVGGTWHPTQRPEGLHLHTPAWGAAFVDFPPPEDAANSDVRPSGAAVFEYLRRFAEHTQLYGQMKTSSHVEALSYDSQSRTATLNVRDKSGQVQQHGPFDLVVHTALASEAHIPVLPGQNQYLGANVHSSQMSQEFIESLLARDTQHVVVVGGSKSACDAIVALTDAGVSPERITWLYRRAYQFAKVERFFHDRSWLSTARAYLAYCAFRGMGVSGWLVMWLLDYSWTYDSDPWLLPLRQQPAALYTLWMDWRQFHFGQLDARERIILASHTRKVRGNPVSFNPAGLVLEDGSQVASDVVIWATGYRTGIEKMNFDRDKQPLANQVITAHPVFEHAVVPVLPVLLIAQTFFVALGPTRGYSLADYAIYHSCVRPLLTERTMMSVAANQKCKQTPASGMLFNPGFFVNLPLLYSDLGDRMILDITAPASHFFDLVVRGRLHPIQMQLLPRRLEDGDEFCDKLAKGKDCKWEQVGHMLKDEVEGEWIQ